MGVAYGRLKLKDRGSEENAGLGMIGMAKSVPEKVSLRRSVKSVAQFVAKTIQKRHSHNGVARPRLLRRPL